MVLIQPGRFTPRATRSFTAAVVRESVCKVGHEPLRTNTAADTPDFPHLVVFSNRVLLSRSRKPVFRKVRGIGFGSDAMADTEKVRIYPGHRMFLSSGNRA